MESRDATRRECRDREMQKVTCRRREGCVMPSRPGCATRYEVIFAAACGFAVALPGQWHCRVLGGAPECLT